MLHPRRLFVALLAFAVATASEFPERECCDPVYPLPAVSASVTPDPPSSVSSSSAVTQETLTGHPMRSKMETLNCLLARQLCLEDSSCSPILETIPRVCGAEFVSCSTVTVTKCQAALRTLQLFPFFKPTCLCREPQLDQECNSFRNFLFDHPCMFVTKKEKDPYPIEALPTCNHAMSVCQKEKVCSQLFEGFKTHCKVRDGKCVMEDREACHEAWTNIRYSPMFGCICPNNHMKKRCDRVFTLVNHNPCIGSSPKVEETESMTFQSTCNQALELCNKNAQCRAALGPVQQSCDMSRCRRQNCMDALQTLYRTLDLTWTLEIAFCLCKKTKNSQDECLVAQEVLHPVCAQQPEGAVPTCHSLAEYCRDDQACKVRLENYEQSCAVDSVTKQCAGAPSECRKAMLGILGTALRSNCACKGTDFSQLYDCMGWQRVLWFNPCVVESQREFHTKKMKQSYTGANNLVGAVAVSTTSLAPTTTASTAAPPSTTAGPASTAPTTTTGTTTGTTTSTTTGASTTVTTTTTTTTSTTTTTTTTTTPEPTTEEPTTHIVTTESTLPPRFCVVQRPHQPDQYISEGEGKRLYRDDEPDCSEVCQCGEGELLACNTVCVERAACKTDFAFYNHAAPAYQAYRGRCLCYSGRFICMRPAPGSYKLPQGVFLFLGYSEADEALLKPLIKMEVQDAGPALEALVRRSAKHKFNCNLSLYSLSKENIILVAKLAEGNSSLRSLQQSNAHLLRREKDECVGALQELSERVNARHASVHSHLLLSMFKMAEVEVVIPASGSSSLLVLNLALVVSAAATLLSS